jgi:hypothetical protein
MSKFKSSYFENATALAEAKDDAFAGVEERQKRLEIIRKFSNGLATMTEEEARKLGRVEIVNHLLAYRNLSVVETSLNAIVSSTNNLVEIIVDTDNPEKDLTMGTRASEAINLGAIHRKDKFKSFWRKVSGECLISGGLPVVQHPRHGWLPDPKFNMIFPKECDTDPDKVTYAFDPVKLKIDDLEKLAKSDKVKGKFVYRKAIQSVLDAIRKQIQDRVRDTSDHGAQVRKSSVRDNGAGSEYDSFDAWWYYEKKYRENGDSYVSSTLFISGYGSAEISGAPDDKGSAAKILVHIEEAYKTADEWLHFIFLDAEIGGEKNMDTIRGMAELVYPSSLEMEELLNLMIEGDKIRAKPKFKAGSGTSPGAVLKWSIEEDTFAPDGIEELQIRSNTSGLQTPLSMLTQNVAGMTSSSVANSDRGGELRQQAVERQQISGDLQGERISTASNHLDCILETCVLRLLTGNFSPGTEGYQEAMFVRSRLEKYDIDPAWLGEREHGRFKNIRVRARRMIGNGDPQLKIQTADWMMANIQQYPPASRPLILRTATTLRTGDPDFAETVVKVPQAIINAQKVTAENEFDTIARRAAIGQIVPTGSDDVDQDHIPIHFVDMQALIGRNALRPWDKLDALVFAGLSEHVSQHMQNLMGNPATNREAKQFMRDYQNLVEAAAGIIQEVEEREGSEQSQLTPKEQAELQIKMAELELKAQEFGVRVQDLQRIDGQRQARVALSKRQQFSRELTEAERLKIERERLQAQKEKPSPKTTK